MTAALFLGGLIVIVISSELFTNSVEWAGYRLHLGSGATGSLLAALGTALPETIVPVIALIQGAHDADRVAIGAVLGGPFLLLTLGVAVTGLATMARRRDPVLRPDPRQLRRDLGTFAVGFAVLAIGLPLPRAARIVLGSLLLCLYANHVRMTLGADSGDAGDEPEPLHLWRFAKGSPHAAAIALQLAIAVGGLIWGAGIFVDGLTRVADIAGIPSLVLALLLVPIATELPETLNSVLWVRGGADTLAVGNVIGSVAFQACIPGFIGLSFTSWSIGGAGYIVGGVTVTGAALVYLLLRGGRSSGGPLTLAGLLWVGYAVTVLALGTRIAAAG